MGAGFGGRLLWIGMGGGLVSALFLGVGWAGLTVLCSGWRGGVGDIEDVAGGGEVVRWMECRCYATLLLIRIEDR